eukprot:6192171-Pleurochrysis_carterae.AAC.1
MHSCVIWPFQVSTLAQPNKRFTPPCYGLMYDWLLPNEVFKEKVRRRQRGRAQRLRASKHAGYHSGDLKNVTSEPTVPKEPSLKRWYTRG